MPILVAIVLLLLLGRSLHGGPYTARNDDFKLGLYRIGDLLARKPGSVAGLGYGLRELRGGFAPSLPWKDSGRAPKCAASGSAIEAASKSSNASVAQFNRASDFGSEGCRYKSCPT